MASSAYEKIRASCELPSPKGVALEILELTQHENTTARQLAATVEKDPAISASLLKVVNSPLAGVPGRIASVQRAVSLLGSRTTACMALSFSLVSDHRSGRCEGFDYDAFWSESLGCASAARQVANRLKAFAPDEAFTCGLLCSIGRLALATAFPKAYTNILEELSCVSGLGSLDRRRTLAQFERAGLDIDHHTLAAEMMADWHLPETVCEAVAAQSAFEGGAAVPGARSTRLTGILHLSRSIAMVLIRPAIYRDELSSLIVEANRLGINPGVHSDLFDAVGQDWREVGTILSVATRQALSLAEIYSLAEQRRTEFMDDAQEARPQPIGVAQSDG